MKREGFEEIMKLISRDTDNTKKMTYQLELVWNREFDFVCHGSLFDDLPSAIRFAKEMENSGDGARVKKTRIVDSNGVVVWAYGKKTKMTKQKSGA